MLARCFCPKHGKLDFKDIHIDNGIPVCRKCKSVLEYGKVRPRRVEKKKKKPKKINRKSEKSRRKTKKRSKK